MKSSTCLFLLSIAVFQLGTALGFSLFGIWLWESEDKSQKPRICAEDEQNEQSGNVTFLGDFQRANERFALCLMQLLESEGNNNQNVLVSPFSIGVALSMAMVGADGDTYRQIHRANGFSKSLSRDHITSGYQQLLPELSLNNVSIGNALAVKQNLHLWHDYRTKLQTNFSSELFEIDPSEAQVATDRINEWCSNKTQGLITSLVSSDDFSSDTAAVLLNAIFFQADWAVKFLKIPEPMKFYTNKAQSKLVKYMLNVYTYQYAQFDDGQLVKLWYLDTNVSMFVFLPSEHYSSPLSALFEKESLTSRISKLNYAEGQVEVSMPPFKFESLYSQLEKTLKKLGILDAFDFRANFSRMSKKPNLALSKVLHKTVIEVDLIGTRAAAVTGSIFYNFSSKLPPKVILNRPFVFFIREQVSGAILFSGVIRDPSGLQPHA